MNYSLRPFSETCIISKLSFRLNFLYLYPSVSLGSTQAVMYWTVLGEMQCLDLHMKIELQNELTPKMVEKYDTHVHEHVLPPADRSSVTVLAGDGHEKVLCRCEYSNRSREKNGRTSVKLLNPQIIAAPQAGPERYMDSV